MKIIPLTNGEHTTVDDEDYDWVNQWRWHYSKGYAIRSPHENESIRLHRAIMNAPEGVEVDHIDRNGLNNQKHNLRLATPSQQNMNRGKAKTRNGETCSSRYKGVTFRSGKWQAVITKDRKQTRLGSYADEKIAALAYDNAARTLFGEFANLNLPEIDTEGIDFLELQRSDYTSKCKGIHFCSDSQRWRARIRLKGNTLWAGCYPTEQEAFEARQEALKRFPQAG